MKTVGLRRLSPGDVGKLKREPVSPKTLAEAGKIVDAVREGGETALREYAEKFGEIAPDAPLVIARQELEKALAGIDQPTRRVLERTAQRIRAFAQAQRRTAQNVATKIAGGRAGHTFAPVHRVGCYAPGGRFPLVSSVLMTAIPAKVAGVSSIWVATPRPSPLMLAAAAVAGAEAVVVTGGAHTIAALAHGVGPIPACDMVVGPGNRWVTAAKLLVSGQVGIDMLAGPSELVVVADASADPVTVAADLLAQAEHDPDALPVLISLDEDLVRAVNEELGRQSTDLPTASVAVAALANGFAVVTDLDTAVDICNRLAPEHLELLLADAKILAERFEHYGALFIGAMSAEVFGDYGAGPNHTLPTGGAARFTGGLSVFTFLRLRTWLEIESREQAAELIDDAVTLARLEGLEGHARSAKRRK